MPNPRAQKPLTLDQAVSDIKSLAQPAQALGDMMASTLRGSVAATAGLPGDVRELIDLFGPEAVERVLGKRVMPTTEEMKQILPKATNYENPYESLGEFMALPKTGTALKAARYGAGRGAGALTRTAGQAISDAMIHQAGPLASGPLSALAPRTAMTNVVKPKGGNWLAGSVEKSVEPLKSKVTTENFVNYTPEQVQQMVGSDRLKRNDAINQWIDRNLTNYIKKEMATPEDPVRKLAEEGITHLPAGTPMPRNMSSVWTTREEAGFPAAMGTSRQAQVWEALADKPVGFGTAGEMINVGKGEPWMEKVDPFTKVHAIAPMESGSVARDLGFDHIVDVLKEDLVTGRIRPEQLNKISMEQAVRRTHEYDQELAKKMAEAKAAAREGLPVHKEYPEGYKWIQLNRPGAFAQESDSMGHSVRGYEPPKGHPDWIAGSGKEGDLGYGHGGWEAIKSGKAKVYSLIDSKGEPHVTIEVGPAYRDRGFRGDERPVGDEYYTLQQQYVDGQENGTIDPRLTFAEWWRSTKGIEEPETLPRISQIKGKGNAKPVESYIPYVQDFVRSGNWADVGDFHNTGLKHASSIPERETFEAAGIKVPKYVTDKEHEDMIYEYLKRTGTPYDADFMSKEYGFPPPEAGMAAGGKPPTRYPTEQEREAMRKLRESFVPAATEAERLKRLYDNMDKSNKKVSFSDNPDAMMMELGDVHMAGGGLLKKAAKAIKGMQEILPEAEREANKAKFLETSKVKDRLYHGTDADIKSFDPEKIGQKDSGWYGKGFYLTSKPETASAYASFWGEPGEVAGRHANVMPVHLSLRNPFYWPKEMGMLSDPAQVEKMTNELKAMGHDGIVVNTNGRDEFIAFSPNQIKSDIGNRGTYDIKEADINKAGGGKVEKLLKLVRAPAKSKEEIRAIAERVAPQMTGEFVRGEKGTQSVAGKTQKQFAREKEIKHNIRPTDAERPLPQTIDYEKLKDNVVMGIAGDPTITGQTVESVAGSPLRSAAPQHGGPLYGLGRDDAHFWASNLGAARNVQNRVREIGQQYDQPVLGQYVMMGPESINYAQHFADANLNAIDPTRMTKKQIEGFNKLIRQGSDKSGPRPAFPGIENPEEAYLHFAVDPELRKHFNALMQMPTVTEKFGLPSGIDVRHAVTEPALRDLETGVTGYSVGQMRPDIYDLKLSEHPTYSHDIPGHFLGQSKYPIPYQLMFPDTVEAIRANPKQAPHEFGSLKMIGPRQTIDQQMIDEIKQYEEMMKSLTGKAEGGEITVKPKKMAGGGEITAEDLEIEERPL